MQKEQAQDNGDGNGTQANEEGQNELEMDSEYKKMHNMNTSRQDLTNKSGNMLAAIDQSGEEATVSDSLITKDRNFRDADDFAKWV